MIVIPSCLTREQVIYLFLLVLARLMPGLPACLRVMPINALAQEQKVN